MTAGGDEDQTDSQSGSGLHRTARRRRIDYSNRRPLGYIDRWKPQRTTTPLLNEILAILNEYQAQWPLTVRQVYYRVVATALLPKGSTAEGQVERILNRGRRAQKVIVDGEELLGPLVPWHAIRDDGAISVVAGVGYDGPGDFWRTTAKQAKGYERDVHEEQERQVWVWCEAAGMHPAIVRILDDLPATIVSGGGQNSLTLLHGAAAQIICDGRDADVFYIGDLDRQGVVIEDRVADELEAFLGATAPHLSVRFTPLAVTPEQVDQHHLPEHSGAPGDYQAEALPPDVFERVVRQGVESAIDLGWVRAIRREGERERMGIIKRANEIAEEYGEAAA